MKFISQFATTMLVGIFVPLVLAMVKKNSVRKEARMNAGNFTIACSARWSIYMLVMSALIVVLLFALNMGGEANLAANIFGPVCVLLFLFGAYATARMRIVVTGESIVVTPIFGKVKQYCFRDIAKIKIVPFSNGQTAYYVYGDKRLFSLDDTLAGTNLFLLRAKALGIPLEK
jgi:hypothetical protein